MMKFNSNHLSWINRHGMAINTDLYEMTMLAGYLNKGMVNKHVCFEYFFRELPPDTGFAIFTGLDHILKYLENLNFSDSDLEYLRSLHLFNSDFIDWLSDWHCECDLWSITEGSIIFPNEPILRIEGPLGQAQLLETFLLNSINYSTLIATKAARICLAAEGDPVIEFGLRRAHGPDGALSGSRAAYIGGCNGTSNCLAGKTYGIPVSGTMAHSWVMSFPSELESFQAYLNIYPDDCVLLVDTYDTVKNGIPNAIAVFKKHRQYNPDIIPAIRIDSGDLAKLSKIAYGMFVNAGFNNPTIIASNDLDETLIADIKRQGAKINAWGVGTHLITSKGYPAFGGVYKLTAIKEQNTWIPKIKMSSNISKLTTPGRKTIYRFWDRKGHPEGDMICDASNDIPSIDNFIMYDKVHLLKKIKLNKIFHVKHLLKQMLKKGKLVNPFESLESIRNRAQKQIDSLTPELKRLRNPDRYPVGLSEKIAKTKRYMIENNEG